MNPVIVRNDHATRMIMAALATTHPHHHSTKIEQVLDKIYPSRRVRSAAQNGMGAARTGDKATSIEAASKVNVTKQQSTILVLLNRQVAPLHATAIANFTTIGLSSVSTRMKELVSKGLVSEEAPEMVNGRLKTTYKITSTGKDWVSENRSVFALYVKA